MRKLTFVLCTLGLLAPGVGRAETPRALLQPPAFLQTSPPAPSTDKAWYSIDNLSIAAGIGWRWQPELNSGPKDEAIVGLYNAWQLTEHVDAIGNVKYGVDSGKPEYEVGLRVILKMPK